MRPTSRAVLLFAAGVPLALGLTVLDERLWPAGLLYIGVAALIVGADGVLAPSVRSLSVGVDVPSVLYVGAGDPLRVHLSWDSAGRPVEREVDVEIAVSVGPLLRTPERRFVSVTPGEDAKAAVPLHSKRRGTAGIDRVWLRWRGPWGLMSRWRIEPVEATIPVLPNIRLVQQAAVRSAPTASFFGLKPEIGQGEGAEFDALREYVPGFDRRWIDWKRSARHHSLLCKEFRAERNHQIVIAVDTGHLMNAPVDGVPKLDHAINAGLVMAYAGLRSGDRIGLFSFDSKVRAYTQPVGGVQNFWRIQRAAAGLEYSTDETNFALAMAHLAGRLGRRSLVVVLTEFVDTVTAELMIENLQRLTVRHLVLFVTLTDRGLQSLADAPLRGFDDVARTVIADTFLRDRAVVVQKLRRLGVHCIEAPDATLGAALIDRYLTIKRRNLI